MESKKIQELISFLNFLMKLRIRGTRHDMRSDIREFSPCKGIQKTLLLESGILSFGNQNTTKRIRNPTTIGIQNSSYTDRLELRTWDPESTALNPESKSVLDVITCDERVI